MKKMTNLMNNLKKYSLYFVLLFLTLSIISCNEDDDDVIEEPEGPTATIVAEAQIVSQDTLVVDSIDVSTEAWLVVRKVNEDGSFSEILGEPILLEEGTTEDVKIKLGNTEAGDVMLEDGNNLILMLHEDDDDGVFEYEGTTGADGLITDDIGSAITETVEISSPMVHAEDQTVVDNTVTFENFTTEENVWIVLHNSNEDGTINETEIVGRQYVAAGEDQTVAVAFDDDFTYTPGQTLYSRLYWDDPADGEFTFEENPEQDVPVTFGFEEDNEITDSFVVD